MTDWNVHLYAFDDLDQVREAVATIPDGVDVYVCDGRYVDFRGDSNLTDGLDEFCADNRHCHYHAPDKDRLPFGDPTAAGELRSSVHEKAAWVNYEVLPQDEWTLKMDADERLTNFKVDLAHLKERWRYCPRIYRKREDECHIARLWQPRHWTVWIDDCLLPRDIFPRGYPLERLARVHLDPHYSAIRFAYREEMRDGDITIHNVGIDRPREYQERRVAHLQRLGRETRAEELADLLPDPDK